ncbi:Protein kinase [Pyrenophora tritici-repentis]|nr:Protein kinase [Pyrenophora tritici-repentis]
MANDNPGQLQDLEFEIRALANSKIYEHPNIIDLLDWGYDTIHELPPDDQDLRNLQMPLRVPVLQICRDIAAGLECLRDCRIIHNDLKSENVLVFREGDKSDITAKLADFGFATDPQKNKSLTFASYGRTKAWKPPESLDYDPVRHKTCNEDLLFKSESYAYGMLALYTLFSPPGRSFSLPFSREKYHREHEINIRVKSDDLSVSQQDMRATWVAIESSFLAEHPEDRHHVSLSELEFSATVLPAGSFVSNQEQRILPRRRPPLYNKGWRFYIKLQPELFQLLNTGVSTELQGYPGDILFGMALSRASAKLKEYHSDVKSLINGATAVAQPSIRAEGIVMRINSAIPGGGSEKHAHTPNPNLYEAAASGSITAFSDLRKSDTNKARTAEQVFRCKGGYNRESILAARFEYTAIKQKIISSANSSTSLAPSELCITIGPDEIYDDHSDPRNTLLHLAAAFGVCEAIIHLTEDKHLDLNARNTEDETPLYKASIAGQYEATVLLLNLGADPSICSSYNSVARYVIRLYDYLLPLVVKELSRLVTKIYLSFDGWTTKGGKKGFLSIVTYYVTADGKLRDLPIALP